MAEQKQNGAQAVIGLIVTIGMAWFFFGGGLEKQAAKDLQGIQDKVASDSVRQYEIASRSGNAIDVCVQAGMVAAAYLQAKDEANYQTWKRIESTDCARAGLPK